MFYRRFLDFPRWELREPLADLDRVRREMDRLADNLKSGNPDSASAGVFPLVNVTEDNGNYYIRAELPGMAPDSIDISTSATRASIAGERLIAEEGDGVTYHRRERDSGAFSRMIELPGPVDPDKVEASYIDGILKIVLPKSEASKPKQIKVN